MGGNVGLRGCNNPDRHDAPQVVGGYQIPGD